MTDAPDSNWEYKTVVRDVKTKRLLRGSTGEELTAALNEHGGDGWELISASPIAVASNFNLNSQTRGLVFFFKRPRGRQQPPSR